LSISNNYANTTCCTGTLFAFTRRKMLTMKLNRVLNYLKIAVNCLFHVKQLIKEVFEMAKQKSVQQLDTEIERLKRKVEIAELKKKLKKSGGR